MQQFDLSLWLQDKSRKVVTRDGREVEIYYSPNSRIALIGRTSDNEIHQYNENGYQHEAMNQAKNDLFFADEEEKLTKFEKTMIQFSHERNSLIQFEHTTEEINAHLHLYSKKLLDLARKELQPEFDKELDEAYKTRDEVVYLEGYDKGHEDTLKDFLEKACEWISKNAQNYMPPSYSLLPPYDTHTMIYDLKNYMQNEM